MKVRRSVGAFLGLAGLVVTACAGPAQPASSQPSSGSGASVQPATSRTLNVGVPTELPGLAPKIDTGVSDDFTKRLFNATLAFTQGDGSSHPYLAESLPQLNSDTWRVSADGTMETTYHLRPSLTWHDGQPLVADDFVFAFQVYTTPGSGQWVPDPQNRISDVQAPDTRTVVIHWKAIYPGAGVVQDRQLDPLPRHILGQPLTEQGIDKFVNLPFWTTEYIGAGPYRLQAWEPGVSVEGAAFEGHVLGRPKIDRVIVHFVPDQNTMLTNLLSNNMDAAMDNSLTFEQAAALKKSWDPSQAGTVLLDPVQPRFDAFQFRPEYADPSAILDLKVRRALASSVDKDAIIAGLFSGANIPTAAQFLPPTVGYFADLDRAVTKYPYDLRQTEQLMNDAGYRKGSDGFFADANGKRFAFQQTYLTSNLDTQLGTIMSDGWHRAGFDVTLRAIPSEQASNLEVRATYPATSNMASGAGEGNLSAFSTSAIPSADNRWRGNNRGGWSNAEYDQLWDAFNATLDRPQQVQQIIRMMQVATNDATDIFLFFNPRVVAFQASLSGPALGPPEALKYWNIQDWQLT